MLPPLTDTEREAIEPFLELCAEREIRTGWAFGVPTPSPEDDTWFRYISAHTFISIEGATREQYNSLCWIGTKELRDVHDRFIDENIDGEWEAVHTNWHDDSGYYKPIKTEIPATEPELAAITAALREVGG